jgi:hypothetical protein
MNSKLPARLSKVNFAGRKPFVIKNHAAGAPFRNCNPLAGTAGSNYRYRLTP